jgi:signal transduction histidine kinase
LKRSLYLRLFLMFYAVLFAVMAVITATFAYSRQKALNDQQAEILSSQARSLAQSAYDAYVTGTMTEGAYQRLVLALSDNKTEICIINYMGSYIYMTSVDSSRQILTEEMINSIYNSVVLGGEEFMSTSQPDFFFSKQTFTIAMPVMGAFSGGNWGAVCLSRQFLPISMNLMDGLLFGIAAAVLVLSAFLLLFMVKSVVKPLGDMAEKAHKYASGDFSVRAGVSGIKEIDMLADSLNTMAEDLAKLDQLRIGFVANVSHELRSPLTSMNGYLQGMLDETIPPEDREKYLNVVSQETKRLTRLVEDLLNLSRIESGNMPINKSKFDICELMRRVLIKYEARINSKNLNVEVIFNPEQCYVNADPDRIEQVMSNLVDNAIKFLPEEGTLSLYTSKGVESVYVGVKDNGAGISQEDLPFIFERFYKADKAHTSGTGTGLGLSIAAKIVEYHGYKLTCKSEEGEGSEFSFHLELHKCNEEKRQQ